MQKLIKFSLSSCHLSIIRIYMYPRSCSKIMKCIFQLRSFPAALLYPFLPLLLLAAAGFRVVAYPNAEYLGGSDLHHKQFSSHNLLKPRDPQDSRLLLNAPTLDLNIPDQSSSSINQDSSTGWDSPGDVRNTDYINQDKSADLASPDLQVQACAAGPTRANGKLRRGLSCTVRTPTKSTPQAPSRLRAPEVISPQSGDFTPPEPPPTPLKPLPLLIDKETGQVQLDFGPEFAPKPEYEKKGPCKQNLLCCTGLLPFPTGNVENCWTCMS